MRWIKIITLLLFSIACSQENYTPGKINRYYKIDSLLFAQVNLLDSLDPQMKKIASVDNETDTTLLQLDKKGWENEMDIFNDITLNKPALRDSYATDTVTAGDGSYKVLYTANEGVKDEVEINSMHLFFTRKGIIKKIELQYKEQGTLYNAKREMALFFSGEMPYLSGYHVVGYQKMILKDTVQYKVTTHITY